MWPIIIKYFTSSDPHHDISWWGWHRYQQRNTNDVPSGDPLKFYSTWSCILFGVSSGILCRYLLAVYLANLLSGILSCISSGTLSAILSGISSSILSGIYFGVLFYLAYILAFYVAFFLAYILAFYVAFYVAYILAVYLGIYSRSLSGIFSGIPSGRWGPAVPSEPGLGRALVEVQRCPLRSEPCGWGSAVPNQIGSRLLRSSSAHCARKLAKSEELARRKWTWKWRQRWWRRRRTTRRTRRSRNSCDKI